ncbi:intraflagellar transport protein 74 homolog [Pollicipes pollicipes]|uniref:intraflagellar transport protein 74 homolog n=1 Tax=Pollicipes pollicipes TaxID=41117 RepID=UPI0018851FB6|nr:intraflagellar transport protein 74 homolog [Pollicipes pollicipes]
MSRMGSGRPVTGSMEKIRDKSYFMGLLRTKTSELRSEVAKLRRQADSLNQEQATYTTYDTRVKEMAGELLEHQAELADYNVLVELMNMDSDRSVVDGEFEELRHRNGKEALLVEKLFMNRKEKENEIHDVENQIDQERRLADTLVDSMPGEVRDRYMRLQERNVQLQTAIEHAQQQADALGARKNELDADLAASPLKQEAAVQYDKLSYLETKRMELLDEKNSRETPEQERERLLQQVKADNQEMGTLERRIHELKSEIGKASEELQITENDLEDSNSDRNLKYRELRRREEEMQEFLLNYDETKATETQGVAQAEVEVLRTLETISKNLGHVRHLPSFTSKDLGELRDSLMVKEGETAKSRNTLTDLATKHQQLQANHQKIEALDEKVRDEMKTLREKMTKMREEMVILSDLPALK